METRHDERGFKSKMIIREREDGTTAHISHLQSVVMPSVEMMQGRSVVLEEDNNTRRPTSLPTHLPSQSPTSVPTGNPSFFPTATPTFSPSKSPLSRKPHSRAPRTGKPHTAKPHSAKPHIAPSKKPHTASTAKPYAAPTTTPICTNGSPQGKHTCFCHAAID